MHNNIFPAKLPTPSSREKHVVMPNRIPMNALKTSLLFACILVLLAPCHLLAQQWNYDHRIGTSTGRYQFSFTETPDPIGSLDVPLYSGTPTYQWYQSTDMDSLHFTAISGATSATYTFGGPLAQTMFYRRKATDGVSGTSILSGIVRIEIVSTRWENINYSREHTIRIPGVTDWKTVDTMSIGNKTEITNYGDGLGRMLQKVSRETATPSSGSLWGDQVQFASYDKYGRNAVEFLPYVTYNQPGKYKTAPQTDEAQYYSDKYSETYAYVTTVYDRSPLDRPVAGRKPGAAWAASSGTAMAYEMNTAADSVRKWTIGYLASDVPVQDGIYPDGELLKTTVVDVNGKQVVEYTNKQGQLVLKKIQLDDSPAGAHTGWICSYSVYNDFGKLRYTLQPEAVRFLAANSWSFSGTNGATVSEEWCYQYLYDDRGRMTWKKLPGAKAIQMLYDLRDRMVMSQDGNQAAKSTPEWAVSVYDNLDRPVISALYKTTATISQLQSDINAATAGSTTVTHTPPAPIDLFVATRDPVIGVYSATNSITFLPDFQSADGEEFVAEVDPDATGVATSSVITTSGNPISGSDMSNPAVTTVLKYLFYDNYSFAGSRFFDASFTLGYRTSGDLIPNAAPSTRSLSLPTGERTRVLGTDLFLASTTYYDENGAVVQQQAENIKKGVDVLTSQYLFDGALVSTYESHSAAGTGYSSFGTLTKHILDKLGRLVEVQQKHGDNAAVTIASYQLDDMGILKTKRLAPGYTGSGKTEMETLTYSSNILGNITGMNKDYALKSGSYSKWDHFFGYYLGFDNTDGVFSQAQLNGKAGGALWNTQGDDAQRKYEFTYDNAGRLTLADFRQKLTPSDSWSNAKLDFTVSGNGGKINYDLNGNTLSLLHKGVVAGGSPMNVDDLQYSYKSFSNKLASVTDNSTAGTANGALGDFKDGSNGSADDYAYDDNGNLILDLNKNISAVSGSAGGIKYNHLDRPEQITIAGKGTITNVYDANGTKLQRIWTPLSGTPRTTTYIHGFVYEGDLLQFINTAEGRIRVIQPVSQSNGLESVAIDGDISLPGGKKGAYDYFIRDYQQNVRMVLTQETHTSMATATMENARAGIEEPVFGQVTANEVSATRFPVSSIPGQSTGNGWNNASIDSSVSKLSKSTYKIGPNSLLKVMAGDKLNATVQYFYKNAASNTNDETPVTEVLQSLLQTIAGSNAVNLVTKNQAVNIGSQLGANAPLGDALAPDRYSTDAIPKAYLTVLFFDERFNFVEEGSQSVRVTTANASDALLTLGPNIKAPRNGYAYVYVSNESAEPVYFDNMKVSHERGRITEENHYYSYGLRIAAISSRKLADPREGNIDNKYLYNDKELVDNGELNWYDYGFRDYDPQIGRFLQIDPLTDEVSFLTPYQYADGDPVNNVDVDGLFADDVVKQVFTGATEAEAVKKANLIADIGNFSSVILKPSVRHVTKQGSNLATRIFGALKAVGGALETAAGAALVSSGVGAGLGVALVIHGADVAASGVMQTIRGQEQRTFTEQGISKGLQVAGVSKDRADQIAMYGDMAISLGGGAVANVYKATGRVGALSRNLKVSEEAVKDAGVLVSESNAAKTGTKLLGTARDNLLNAVENSKLRNIVNDLYRPGAKIGSGSSMDAFRLEQLTGGTVGGKTHSIKLLNYRTALQRVWGNRANLSAGDRQITKQLLRDIQNALSGH